MNRQVSGWTTSLAVVVGIFATVALWVIAAWAQEVQSDFRDLREDRRELRQDEREVRQDRRDMRRHSQALRDLRASGDHGAAMRARRDLRADRREMRRDVHRLRGDKRELHDRHGLHHDGHARRAG